MPPPLRVIDDPAVAEALERSADAAATRTVLTRLIERWPEVAPDLAQDGVLREALVALSGASRSLSNAVVQDRSLLEPLRDHVDLAREHDVDSFHADLVDRGGGSDGDALRRWKRRGLIRVAARDLLGMSDLPGVGRELAALAQVCLIAALELAGGRDLPLAVIGMGKLGGAELNYASDVDVLFVHDGLGEEAERVARELLVVMASPTAEGIVFRTDANLRPEGRAGPLTRTLDSYATYYEQWARTWEFQSLIKARPVAGRPELGSRFMELVEPLVWPDRLDPAAVHEIRAMKARAEQETVRRGLGDRELKRGRGGIRDIEFAVQLLQLVHARHDRSIRSETTLTALAQLAAAGYVEPVDARALDDAYRFLRTVEHRLQLHDEQQTHTLPADRDALIRLARVLGYRDRPDSTALEQFETAHRARQRVTRSIHERLFFEPLLETLAGAGPLPLAAAEDRLSAFGFLDLGATRAALDELARGFTRRSRLMQELLPLLLEWCSETPDPDLALLQLRRLAEGPTRSGSLATAFRDSPGGAERTCRVLGASRLLGDALRRQPEFVATLGDDAALSRPKTRDQLVSEALETLDWRTSRDDRLDGLRRFKRREMLRVGARDVLGFANLEEVGHELTALADACVEATLVSVGAAVPFAVIGMGRLGGGDLSYASDIDVLFVYDGTGAADFDVAERVATRLISEIGAVTSEGQAFSVDADLRPEGKQGPLARSLEGFAQYYDRWALTWEFQSLIKARPVAGDERLARAFCDLVEPHVYRSLSEDEVRDVRRMKARIERERIPAGEDPQFNLKLGRGSLSDVEFTAQLLQLCHGRAEPRVRTPSTLAALHALRDTGSLDEADATALEESYRFCSRARDYRYLLTGSHRESLPTDAVEAERLGRMLGYVTNPQTALRDDYRRVTRRARHVVEHVFYGRE